MFQLGSDLNKSASCIGGSSDQLHSFTTRYTKAVGYVGLRLCGLHQRSVNGTCPSSPCILRLANLHLSILKVAETINNPSLVKSILIIVDGEDFDLSYIIYCLTQLII